MKQALSIVRARTWYSLSAALACAVASQSAADTSTTSISVRPARTNGEGALDFILEWDASTNGFYRVQQRDRFDTNSPWTTIDMLMPQTERASLSLPALRVGATEATQGFFRVQLPSPEIFSVEPALVGTNGGIVTVVGQCLGTNATLRIGGVMLLPHHLSPGAYAFEIPAGLLGPGVYDLEILDGTNVLAAAAKLFSVTGQPTPVGEAAQRAFEPPVEPPASPSLMKAKEKANRTKCSNNLRMVASTGEIQLEEEDLHVPGIGLDFTWTRTYRSRNGSNTRMGQNWAHSYDISILATNGGIAVLDGTGRRDLYFAGTNGIYACDEIFNTGSFSNDVFTLEFPDTSKWIFNSLSNATAPGAIARIQDRLGNALTFGYDQSSRLTQIVDTLGRTNRVSYDGLGRIQSVTDFSGRVVTYTYWRNGEAGGGNGDLRSVTCPAVTGTPHTNDFPQGKTTVFTYTAGFPDQRLNHNLLTITDAKQQTWLTVDYADVQDPADVNFDRVHAIHRGEHLPARLTYLRQPPSASNHWAVLKTIVNDPEGNVTIDWFDSRNRCVIHRDLAARATPGSVITDATLPTQKPYPSDPDFWETTYEWNLDSLCTRVVFPRGNSTEILYQRARDYNSSRSNKTASRRSDGNPCVIRERACCADLDGDGAPDIADLVWRLEFDPRFGSPAYACSAGAIHGGPRQSTSLDGSRMAADGSRIRYKGWDGTVKGTLRKLNRRAEESYQPWSLDEDDQAVSNPLYQQSGMSGSNPLYEGSHFVTHGMDPRGTVDTLTYNDRGQVLTIQHQGYLLDGSDAPVTSFEYRPNGQLAAIVHPEDSSKRRRRDEFSYSATGAPYLRTWTVDATGPVPGISLFEHDIRGNVTHGVDPRGNTNSFTYNQLDQLVARQTPDTSFGARIATFYTYDANDNVVQVDVENRDDSGALNPTNAFITTLIEFDSLNRERLVAHELTHVVQQRFGTNRTVYDGADNVIEQLTPEAVNGNQAAARVQFDYDVRRLLRQRTFAPGTASVAIDRFDYDANGQLAWRSLGNGGGGAGGSVSLFERDGFGRCVSITDAMGNVQRFGYDANHNLVYTRVEGETNDVLGPINNRRLAETRCTFDSLDRLVTRTVSFFDVFTELPLLDGNSITTFRYAPNRACIRATDDNGNATTYSYDSLGRLESVTDAKLNQVRYSYDGNGNVLSITRNERADLAATVQTFVSTFQYDRLNRCVLDYDNVGNTNRYAYDSRGNLLHHTDPRGNDVCHRYDGLNRRVSSISYVGPCDAGITINTSHVEYDDNSRVVSTTDGNTNSTQYAYDALGRCVLVTHADGTSESLVWSPRSNLSQRTDANGTVTTFTYDELNRCVRKDFVAGPGVSASTTFEAFSYDGMSRLTMATNDVSMLEFAYDSMGNCVKAKQDCIAVAEAFDATGNRTTVEYPSGRIVKFVYDGANLVTNVATAASAAELPGSIFTFAYEGSRLARIGRANGINTRLAYNGDMKTPNAQDDFGWRQVATVNHQVAGGGTVIDRRLSRFDRNQNRTFRQQVVTVGTVPALTTNLFAYDALNRMSSFSRNRASTMYTKSYQLDSNGNRQMVSSNGLAAVYEMSSTAPEPADFQMSQYTVSPFGAHVYDRNGNLISVSDAVGNVSYSYDVENRLVNVSRSVGPAMVPVASFTYDALGRRISKTTYPAAPALPITTQFILDPVTGDILEEHEGPTLRRTHVVPHVLESSGRLMYDENGSPTYTMCDELGTVLAVTDAKGATVERYEYDDFGMPRFLTSDGVPIGVDGTPARSSAVGNAFLFRGMFWDSETTLYCDTSAKVSKADAGRWATDPYVEDCVRYMSPELGRYILRAGVPLRFTFAHHNPWSTDPAGIAIDEPGVHFADVMFNPKEYTLKKEEGGRHTPFHNRYVAKISDFGMSRIAGDNTPIIRGSALGGQGQGASGVAYRQAVLTSREAGSGLATGRRTHVVPHVLESSGTIRSAREAGSGIATGRRTHVAPHVFETKGSVSSREAGSGIATGRRSRMASFGGGDGSSWAGIDADTQRYRQDFGPVQPNKH